jgi:hypothetical protein
LAVCGSAFVAQALRDQAQDGWLQRFLAGDRTKAEINEVAVKGRVADTPESRRIAWARMSLLVLYFNPNGRQYSFGFRVLEVKGLGEPAGAVLQPQR